MQSKVDLLNKLKKMKITKYKLYRSDIFGTTPPEALADRNFNGGYNQALDDVINYIKNI